MEIRIKKEGLASINGDLSGIIVRCINGKVWITQANDSGDYIVGAGERFKIKGKGKVAIQGSVDSLVRLEGEKVRFKTVCPGNQHLRIKAANTCNLPIFRQRKSIVIG